MERVVVAVIAWLLPATTRVPAKPSALSQLGWLALSYVLAAGRWLVRR